MGKVGKEEMKRCFMLLDAIKVEIQEQQEQGVTHQVFLFTF